MKLPMSPNQEFMALSIQYLLQEVLGILKFFHYFPQFTDLNLLVKCN